MAFKCFDCGFYHVCIYSEQCIKMNHSECGKIIRECENCRFGENDGFGCIICTKPGLDIKKKYIPDHEAHIFEDFDDYEPDPELDSYFPF